MAGVVAAVCVAAVVVAAGVATAVVSKNASDKAADAQKKGIQQQNQLLGSLKPEKLDTIAQKYDKQRARNRLEFQKEIDPELAALRQKSKEQLLEQAVKPEETQKSNQLATTLFNEVKEQDPRIEALKQSLITGAEKDLAAGATLPPEFQAELVRAGLNQGGQAGIGYDKNTIGGGVARVLGAAGLQLQRARTQEAEELVTTAQGLTNARVNILATVFPKLRDLESVNRQDALTNFQVANNAIPEVGLTGREAVNAEISRKRGKAGLIQQGADVKSQQAIDQGKYTSAIIGSVASGVTAGYGAYSGGVSGGQMGGSGGGGGVNYAQYANAAGSTGTYGSRTPAQQQNYEILQNYYQ